MDVVLLGNSPSTLTAGILLITRARQLGFPLRAAILGEPEELTPVAGPAIVHAPVVASCGVGRDAGAGGTVVVPGPPGTPVLVSLAPNGAGGWFELARSGEGTHEATKTLQRMARDPRLEARHLAKEVRRALGALGVPAEPALLDILFGAPVSPLTRLAMALRAGRAMGGTKGEPVTRFLSGFPEPPDPLPSDYDRPFLEDLLRYGGLQWILDGLSTSIRDRSEDWLETSRTLASTDGGRDFPLLYALAEVASHLVQLPPHSLLPPLDAAEDGVALCLGAAIRSTGAGDANIQLATVFRFLGGRFVDTADHVIEIGGTEAPEDRAGRWRWFCEQALVGRERANEIWPDLVDPPQ